MADKNDKKKTDDVAALKKMEDEHKTVKVEETPKQPVKEETAPNMLDGFIPIEPDDIPHGGKLYPESWRFAYRSATSKEVANFSTVNERDQPAIINLVEDLIRKCVVIFDTDQNKQIDSGQVNDCHRTWFMLKIREAYLPGSQISYDSVCSFCKDKFKPIISAENLVYDELNEKLLAAFDGRVFKLNMPGIDEPIEFMIQTINNSSKLFKNVVKAYRDAENDRQKKSDKILYDKQFLLFAPYLFLDGYETINDLKKRYQKIVDNEKLYRAYLEIINLLSLDNKEYVEFKHEACGSLEEAQIRFPGGWKKLFIGTSSTSGYFN